MRLEASKLTRFSRPLFSTRQRYTHVLYTSLKSESCLCEENKVMQMAITVMPPRMSHLPSHHHGQYYAKHVAAQKGRVNMRHSISSTKWKVAFRIAAPSLHFHDRLKQRLAPVHRVSARYWAAAQRPRRRIPCEVRDHSRLRAARRS